MDAGAAEHALDRLAAKLKVDRVAAAEGVHRVVNTNMAEGIRLVSVRRGVDPRRFALLSFGGAAGLHVTDVARQLDLTRVVVPRVAAVLSAWGMLATDLRFEVSRTHIGDTARLDGAGIKRLFAEMEQEGLARLRALIRRAGARAALGGDALRRADLRDHRAAGWHRLGGWPIRCRRSCERFHNRHEELYTYALREQDAVLVNARAAVIGVLPGVPQEPVRPAQAMPRRAASGASGCAAGPRAGVRLRRVGAGAGDRWSGDRRVGDDYGAAAARQPGDGHAAWLAGYRCLDQGSVRRLIAPIVMAVPGRAIDTRRRQRAVETDGRVKPSHDE